ncbi:MAG TPA: substrate-binding domain-containing protein [Actinomycetota bacterium]|nr:substrate-binding domain-containing protein [Actinomycetota bacterium]
MRTRRGIALVIVPICLTLAVLVGLPGAAIGAGHPSVSISPRAGLLDFTGDGQYVTVSWRGFPRDSVLYLRECVRGATDPLSQCAQPGFTSTCGDACPGIQTLGLVDKTGAGSAVAQVAIGLINVKPNLDAIAGKTITCDFQNACSLFIGTTPSNLATMTEVPISFATPPLACPTDGSPLTAEGGSAGFRVVEFAWSVKVCAAPLNLSLDYTLQPAGTALDDYIQGGLSDVDLAVVPQPMDAPQTAALSAAGGSVGYAPIAASGLVFAYRVFDQTSGHQVTTLTLTPDLLAKIFTGQVTQWYLDKEIEKLNPTVAFPTFIATVGRGDANEDTQQMTSWMWANARKAWVSGGRRMKPNPFASGPTDLLPSLGQIDLVTGARGEARVIAKGDGDVVSTSTYGWIGYVDSSWAASYQLPTVRIKYPNGKVVRATPRTIARGIAVMRPDVQGLLTPAYGRQDPKAWPIPTVSYAAIPHGAERTKNPPTPEKLDALRSFLTFAAGAGQTSLPPGYVPLPPALRQRTKVLTNQIMKAPPEPTPHPTAAPPPPPPPVVAPPPPVVAPPAPPPAAPPPPSVAPPTSSIAPQQVVYVAPVAAPVALVASPSRLILPGLVFGAMAALAVGVVLLGSSFIGGRSGRAPKDQGSAEGAAS